MEQISWEEFERVELRVGTIVEVGILEKARKPAYTLKIDFGDDIGLRQSSAQITDLYDKEELIGKQIVGVVNFPPKRISGFVSEVLVTGFLDNENRVVLAVPDKPVPNGQKLF